MTAVHAANAATIAQATHAAPKSAADARWQAVTDAMGRYADGDHASFDRVYAELSPLVLANLRRWTSPQQAEDLLQKTFLKVHRARDRYRRGAPVGPWVLSIARHVAIDDMRRRGRAKEDLTREGALPEPTASAPPMTERFEAIEAVRAAVDGLPDSQRSVVAMHKLEERPFREVATALGIKEGAARIRAHRAYGRLRTALAAFEPAASPA